MNSTQFCALGVALRSLVAAMLLALIVASGIGCGQRGPLYLPDAEPGAGGAAAEAEAEARPDSPDTGGTGESPDSEDNE